jgi:hypothetical protein
MKQKHLFVKVLLVTVITSFLCVNVYSYIATNGAGGGYGGSGESSGGSSICSQNNEIEYFIILGAGNFLDAKSDVQQLLKAVELQDIRGVNYFEMQYLVENALFHMKNAQYIYDILIRTAEVTPYNESVQSLLKDFDYDAYMLENGLNKSLFDIVRQHLQAGDITGIFKRTYTKYTKIIQLLEAVKKEVYNNKMPELSIFWQLNETLDNTSTIGSYVARVFAAIQ